MQPLPPLLKSFEEDDDKDTSPTTEGPTLKSFEGEEEPGFFGKIWRGIASPHSKVDVTPEMRRAMDEYSKEHPYIGKMGESLVEAERSAFSPLGAALGTASVATGIALKYGRPVVARTLARPGLALGAGTMAHGGYQTVKNVSEGKYPEAAVSAMETGMGAFGVKHARRAYGSTLPSNQMMRTWKSGPIDPSTGMPTKIWSAPPNITKPPIVNNPENAKLGLGGRIYAEGSEVKFGVNPKQATSSTVAAPVAPMEPGKTTQTTPPLRAKNVNKKGSKVKATATKPGEAVATGANSQSNVTQELTIAELRQYRQDLLDKFNHRDTDPETMERISVEIGDIDQRIGRRAKKNAKPLSNTVTKVEEPIISTLETEQPAKPVPTEQPTPSTVALRKQRQELINQFSTADSQTRQDLTRQISALDVEISKDKKTRTKSNIITGEEGAIGDIEADRKRFAANRQKKEDDLSTRQMNMLSGGDPIEEARNVVSKLGKVTPFGTSLEHDLKRLVKDYAKETNVDKANENYIDAVKIWDEHKNLRDSPETSDLVGELARIAQKTYYELRSVKDKAFLTSGETPETPKVKPQRRPVKDDGSLRRRLGFSGPVTKSIKEGRKTLKAKASNLEYEKEIGETILKTKDMHEIRNIWETINEENDLYNIPNTKRLVDLTRDHYQKLIDEYTNKHYKLKSDPNRDGTIEGGPFWENEELWWDVRENDGNLNRHPDSDLAVKEYTPSVREIKAEKNTLAENLRKGFRNIKSRLTDETGAVGPGADELIKRRRAREAWLELKDDPETKDPEYKAMLEHLGVKVFDLTPGETWKKRLYDFAAGKAAPVEQKVASRPVNTAPRPAAGTPAGDIARDILNQSPEAIYNQGRTDGSIPASVTFAKWKEQAIASSQGRVEELKIDAPPPPPKVELRTWQRWKQAVDELDAIDAPDADYRDILSTGARDKSSGETWREKVLRFIELDRNKKLGADPKTGEIPLRTKHIQELSPGKLTGAISAPPRPETRPIDKRKKNTARSDKGRYTPPSDMFDRGELEPKPEPTHTDFLKSMLETLKDKGVKPRTSLKKLLKDETGSAAIGGWLPNVTPHRGASNLSMREAVREWGDGRNVSHLLKTRLAKATNNSSRDSTLLSYLRSVGINTTKKNVRSQSIWQDISKIDAKAGRMIENYFGKPTRGLREIASVTRGTKNLALTGGFPGRTGQVSAHAFNILRSDYQGHGVKKAIQNYGEGSIDPQVKIDYVKQHQTDLKKLVEGGMTWSDIEGQSAMGPIETKIDAVPVLGALNRGRRKWFENPLFQVHLPATKLKRGIEKVAELRTQGMGEKEAYKLGAEWANDFSGSVNTTFRSKTWNDLAGIVALAPHWTESRFQVAKKGLMPIGKGGVKGYGKPMARGLVLSAPGVAARIVAAGGLYKYLTESKSSESTTIPAGTADYEDSRGRDAKKNRGIDLTGTAVEPHRMIAQTATQLAQGNVNFSNRYIGNKASMPLQAAETLFLSGIDPYGNPISGKDRFGKPIPGFTALMNMLQEGTRPITPTMAQGIVDYYRGKGSLEEIVSRSFELPLNYTFKERPKKASSVLGGLK